MGLPQRLRILSSELRRRKVYHVSVAYGAVGMAISISVPDLFGAFGFPSWAAPLVIVLIVIGFPIALVMAWAYELAPEETALPQPTQTLEKHREESQHRHPRNRLAILPLDNFSPDPGDRYFADGMTEELISVVSRIEGLDVIARTSVMVFKDRTASISDIAGELRVGAILEGSVRRDGDALRITVQLIDTSDSTHLWAEDYDRRLAEIFPVQRDIARRVADALEVRLLEGDEQRIGREPTSDLKAYDLYLVGRHHLNMRTEESLNRAIELFQRAAEKDPSFALPHAGISEALLFLGIGYAKDPPKDAVARSLAAAERAVELDEDLPEAHLAMAFASINSLGIYAAQEAVKTALALDPGNPQVHRAHGFVFFLTGRFEEAALALDRALALDPMSHIILTESGWPYGYQGKHDIALKRYEAALEIAPDFALAKYDVGWALQRTGRLDEAIQAYEEAVRLSGGAPFARTWLATAYAEAGRRDEAKEILNDLNHLWQAGAPISLFMAVIYESLAEKDLALDALEQAFEGREPWTIWVGRTPELCGFPSLHDEPRYKEMIRRARAL